MKKFIGTTLSILLCMIILAGAAGVAFVYTLIKDAPEIDTKNISALLSENSVVYAGNGDMLDSVFFESKRTNVSYASLPDDLKNAFVSVEDKTFWEHHGFNVVRIVGAAVEGYKTGEKISGTSTITQQLARNLYLADMRNEYSLKRKVIEAYYALLLEKDLTKEQILEAYLNRISLGFGTCGVQAASKAYFAKDVEDLTLPECVALAAITQEPNAYSLIKTLPNASVADDNEDILYRNNTYTYLCNAKASEKRRQMILELMKEQGYVTEYAYRKALAEDLRDDIKPFSEGEVENTSSYFTDYAIKEVVADLMAEYGLTEENAWGMLFNGGLRIYTTLDQPLQNIVETEFANNGNFPNVAHLIRDRAGNILKPSGGILLYRYDNFFNEEGDFVLAPDEYDWLDNGDMVLKAGKRLNFYRSETDGHPDCCINFKGMYINDGGVFSTIGEGTVAVPAKYKYKDKDGNLIIESWFFKECPDFFCETEGGLSIAPDKYSLKQKVVQPQAAMVILDYATGEIKAMAGGRGGEGRLLYNRAVNPRQPGSSIKPIGVYGPALQSSADAVSGAPGAELLKLKQFTPEIIFNGKYWTAASVIQDEPIFLNGKQWPKNWYSGNRGAASLRGSIEQSINVNAVKVFSQIGPEYSLNFLKKLGVTSVVETGYINDMNAAALALGGMSSGISPLEMAGAYGTFANQGRYNKPTAYSMVTNRNGDVLLENRRENTQVMDVGVAFIMTDILRTTVSSGIARSASVPGRIVAGKTGTTSDNYDAWFVGITPEYAASLWIGNDLNVELNEGSMAAARLWSKIMRQVLEGVPEQTFPPMPDDVIRVYGEYFINGTQGSSFIEYARLEEDEGEDGDGGDAANEDGVVDIASGAVPAITLEPAITPEPTITLESIVTPEPETAPEPAATPRPIKPAESANASELASPHGVSSQQENQQENQSPPPEWLFPASEQ